VLLAGYNIRKTFFRKLLMDSKQTDSQRQSPQRPGAKGRRPSNTTFWVLVVVAAVIAFLYLTGGREKRLEITFGQFDRALREDKVAALEVQGSRVYGEFRAPEATGEAPQKPTKFVVTLPPAPLVPDDLKDLLRKNLGESYRAAEPSDNTGMVLAVYVLVTIALFAAVWYMFRRARDQVVGGGLLAGFSKSPARRYESGEMLVTFKDVAGLEGVKRDLQEVVDFLKNPEKFQRLGARVPKGILLVGPPGTGKTLLGRAVAGEAGVPFFSINGSEFIQLFVGVGASRVRDLFATAKENAPSILFIDEIDAVGRHRGAGVGGGHDEREQTLNQILSEMDGFTPAESVIVMAATNRPDVLDPALLRPGRFDRHIVVDRPTFQGRLEIFKVHTRNTPLADDVDLEKLAAATVGLTGADIRNLVNEAALWASRHDKQKVDKSDFDYAFDKVLMGAKREEVLTGKEKKTSAYHEAGHALLAWLVPGTDRVHKVSIIPRGRALGATLFRPEKDRVSLSESEARARLICLLGGRAAEKLVFNQYQAGAENDLKDATHLARLMVAHWGMSERLGPVAFRDGEEHPFLGKEMAEPRRFSEYTARLIDEEIMRIVREASEEAERLLSQNRDKLELLATTLENEETLDEADIERLLGPPASRSLKAAAEHPAAESVNSEVSNSPSVTVAAGATRPADGD